MLFYGILDVIAVCSFRIMKQWRADEELWNIDVHRWAVQVGHHKLRAIYILIRSSMRWFCACLLLISFFLSDSDSFVCGTKRHTRIFSSNQTKIDAGEAVSFSIDACQLTSLYLQIKWPFISKKLQPLSQLMPTPNRFPSKVSIRTTHMLSAFSNEPPNRIGSSDTKPDPIYMQMAMRSTAEWVFGRPTSLGAPPGMPSRPCSRSMDRADGTSTARPQRSAGLRWYFMTWRESYSRVIITYRTFRICAFRSIANSYELLCRPYVQMTMRRPARQ